MAEENWTSPALEFYDKHIYGTLPTAAPITPDLLMRWQPILTGVDEARRGELAVILEFETAIVAEIMTRLDLAAQFEEFMKTSPWTSEGADKEHVLAFYHQSVKRRVLEQEPNHFLLPVNEAEDMEDQGVEAGGPLPLGDHDLESPGAFDGSKPAAKPDLPRPPKTSGTIVALRIAHKAEVEALKRVIETAKSEAAAERQRADEAHRKWVRSVADFDNYQKRVKRDQERDRDAALRKILGDIASVVDNAALVAQNAAKPDATPATIEVAIRSGVYGELMATLHRYGGRPMGVKPGDPFDPTKHEAVSFVTEEGSPQGDVVSLIVREGYMLGQTLLRAASVVVKRVTAPKPPAPPTEAPKEEVAAEAPPPV